jgi:DNA replication and repair protein RecF
MSSHGAALMVRRRQSATDFSARAGKALEDLTGGSERFEAVYDPDVKCDGDETKIQEAIRAALRNNRKIEAVRGVTLSGPHRDDVRLSLNGRLLRKYGSQGQMRTGALALKLAQLEILAGTCSAQPLVLFDDVMAELDSRRQAFFLERLKRGGQALLTGTSETDFASAQGEARVFKVSGGEVALVEEGPRT